MNPAVVLFSVGIGFSAKKMLALVLVTMFVVLSLPFMAVIAMGSDVLGFLSHTPSAQVAETKGFYMGGPVPGDTYVWGNCTYWSYAMRYWAGNPVPVTWGNANTWDDNARADNYIVDHTPTVGAVFQTDSGDWGHVAYVINVNPLNDEWTISEMNAPHLNVISQRTFTKADAAYYTFIHNKKGELWKPSPISIPPYGIGNKLPL